MGSGAEKLPGISGLCDVMPEGIVSEGMVSASVMPEGVMPGAASSHCVEVAAVSFTVPHGQFVAILGPSGCGKSTLLMMVGGLEAVTTGRIAIDGTPMAGPRTSIGSMFQDSTLLPWKSALDNVLFPIRILKRPI